MVADAAIQGGLDLAEAERDAARPGIDGDEVANGAVRGANLGPPHEPGPGDPGSAEERRVMNRERRRRGRETWCGRAVRLGRRGDRRGRGLLRGDRGRDVKREPGRNLAAHGEDRTGGIDLRGELAGDHRARPGTPGPGARPRGRRRHHRPGVPAAPRWAPSARTGFHTFRGRRAPPSARPSCRSPPGSARRDCPRQTGRSRSRRGTRSSRDPGAGRGALSGPGRASGAAADVTGGAPRPARSTAMMAKAKARVRCIVNPSRAARSRTSRRRPHAGPPAAGHDTCAAPTPRGPEGQSKAAIAWALGMSRHTVDGADAGQQPDLGVLAVRHPDVHRR